MPAPDVLETLDVTDWSGPFPPELRERATAALESGRVVVLPRLEFRIDPCETGFLDPSVAGADRKNISLDPGASTCDATALAPGQAERLAALMRRFSDQAVALVEALVPAYAGRLERARTSFRPVEIAGRVYSPRHDDRRLHVDAFPTRPMRGKRILRVFSNVARDGAARDWRVGEPFEQFAQAFAPRIRQTMPGSAWVLAGLGLTRGRRSAYDEIMLALHDAAKLDETYQADAPKTPVAFPAGATWLCYTDQVLHAALSGHSALEQTFHLPVEAMVRPEQSPLRVLERITGRPLA
ncbi:MAG TPA: Kdo hydroxylase family protein [Caulobacteraceae bacterium]|nr:Kdo hydroxylase family protein [Caulobacteraceae bacterium]